jgi:type II secretory pathway pseudopilin PulG
MKLEPNIRSRISSLAREDGFGIVEALVAAIILVLAVLATFTAYDASTRSTFRAQQSQVRLGQAQQEMEKIRALPYDEIAMTGNPGDSSDPSDPRNRVQNRYFNLDRSGSNPAEMVVNDGPLIGGGKISGGVIDPGPEHFQSGDVGGDIYRFVVWQRNIGCDTQTCTSQDFKRVIIVVKPDTTAAGGSRDYIEIHSDFIDPNDSSNSDLPPNGGQRVTGQPFWLTDTPCDPSGTTVREAIDGHSGDSWDPADGHWLHNTLGNCGSGLHTGTTAGAPDALIPALPPGDSSTPTYDYQSDWEPQSDSPPNPNQHTDKGIQIQPVNSGGCGSSWPPWSGGGTGTNPQTKFHVWLTDPMQSDFVISRNAALTPPRNATLVFFSKTINGLLQKGKICAWVFVRSSTGTDTLLPGTQPFSFTAPIWPQAFGSSTIPMDMGGPQTVLATSRLGLAISVGATSDTPAALEFMYDHPNYPAYLEVQTATPCLPSPPTPC